MADNNDNSLFIETLDLGNLLPEEQFDFYADEMTNRFMKFEFSRPQDRDDFPAVFHSANLGDQLCTLASTPAHFGGRSVKDVKEDPRPGIHLHYSLGATSHITQGDDRIKFQRNGLFITNVDVPYSGFIKEPYEEMNVLMFTIPSERAHDLYSTQPEIFGDAVNHHEYAPLLKNAMFGLAQGLRRVNRLQVATFMPIINSLAEFVFSDANASQLRHINDEYSFHLIDIEIMRCVTDSNFSLERAAHDLSMTTEHIEEVLRRRDTNFWDVLYQRRTGLAFSKMTDPSCASMTIEQIAQSCGFSSMSEFQDKIGRAVSNQFEEVSGLMRGKPGKSN